MMTIVYSSAHDTLQLFGLTRDNQLALLRFGVLGDIVNSTSTTLPASEIVTMKCIAWCGCPQHPT